jgi:hypothetical protein
MPNIPAAAPEIKAARTSVDTIEVFAQRLPLGFRRQVEAILQRRVQIKRCRHGFLVPINRPPAQVLPILNWLIKNRHFGACASRVDVAYDFDMEGPDEADALTEWIDHIVVLKWRSSRTHKTNYGTTVYWADKHKGRNIAVYRKGFNTIRLELRFFRAATVRRAGLDDLSKLPQINPKELFDHHVKGRHLTKTYKIKAMRKAVKEDKERATKNPMVNASNFTDIYRSRIAMRIQNLLNRIDGQSLGSRGIEDVSLECLRIPVLLTRPALI